MITLADFFPSGRVDFVRPHFDEKYWAQFGIPARVRTDMWGGELARGLTYRDKGIDTGKPGARRQFGGSRKARGYASGTDGRK